jgi:hypothetical protein
MDRVGGQLLVNIFGRGEISVYAEGRIGKSLLVGKHGSYLVVSQGIVVLVGEVYEGFYAVGIYVLELFNHAKYVVERGQ